MRCFQTLLCIEIETWNVMKTMGKFVALFQKIAQSIIQTRFDIHFFPKSREQLTEGHFRALVSIVERISQ